MADPVLETFTLGLHWPTVDPFLFCAHHDDAYPAGNEGLGPAAALEGRELGMDFEGQDGWRMYHGLEVPGFPGHPHRGFETVTYVRKGFIDHSDSLGATARFGRGDVQWLTAGAGIVHAEMFPLLDAEGPNPLELFQIWLNLPAADKMVDPYFSMLWDGDVPKARFTDDQGRTVTATVIAGALGEVQPPPSPPDSWASRSEADVAIWHLHLEPGARWELPAASGPDTVRTVYVFDGTGIALGGHELRAGTGAMVRCDEPVEVEAADESGATDVLVLQGRPIAEPVAQYGPFVLNDRAGIEQAVRDYQRTQFGGWPWGSEAPVFPREKGRFAVHVDGREEVPAGEGTPAG